MSGIADVRGLAVTQVPGMISRVTDDALVRAWTEYERVLSERAPVSHGMIRPAAGDPAQVCRELGMPEHDVVLTWFGLHDGAGSNLGGGMLLPGNLLLSQSEAVATTRMVADIWADIEPGQTELTSGDVALAGEVVGTWLPGYLMIGTDAVAGGYFLDLRAGPRHGCVRTWEKTEADEWGTDAGSLAELVERVVEAIEGDGQLDDLRPVIINRALEWHDA